ncbi:DUF3488 and transglutaminase-like domain-containing protein [Micromonospora sp. NPDC007230]|uniref:DUF3488 and transglutaminase-like domain-containing protein n=1 Tax=Micromonospora sp. NPDC007230 TaxID=3364237 RepID=UPI0036940326
MLAAAVAGLLFAPVFGGAALMAPIGVPAAAILLTALATNRWPALLPWCPLLLPAVGLLAVAETTLWSTTAAGVPTGRTLRALAAGTTESWQLALQSTWPARPDPALLLFVPLLVVLAGTLGIELLHRLGSPLLSLAPSFAVALLSQCYAALPPGTGAAAALGYATVAGALLAATRAPAGDVGPAGRERFRPASALSRVAVPVALAALGAVIAGALLPAGAPRYSLRRDQPAPLPQTLVASPLDEIAHRLSHPGTPVFRVEGADGLTGADELTGVDRWPLVVLDSFDGVNWTAGARYRRMGTELQPGPAVTVPVRARTAVLETAGLAGVDAPWLPSQTWPARVGGVEPLVEERHGTLLLPESAGPARYTLTWWQPQVDAATLSSAAIDPAAPGGLGEVGAVPPGVAELAEQAVGGGRPSFQAALLLERYLGENYRLATGADLPTGHAWPQLADFLLRGKQGTSEQFAAAYVALARIRGIPARLAVGFRAPAARDPDGGYTVRNGDILAWPEVAVTGIGWVPLDPSGSATAAPGGPSAGLAGLTAQARAQLPAADELRDPPIAPRPGPVTSSDDAGALRPLGWLGAPALLLLVGWLFGVPAARVFRTWRRRRPGSAGVVGAWAEARDRLRGHGLRVTAGMTVGELSSAAARVADEATVAELRRLGAIVDRALWSGVVPGPAEAHQAWAAVRSVRRGLARRGRWARVRAMLDPRTLLPPR